ncbi:autophagy-related 4a isoform X3 [Amblyomma americanum]
MADVFNASLTYEVGAVEYDDFKPSEEPVFILGTKYSTFHELDDLRNDVTSKIWLTYRKNFPAISGTDHTSDTGWGCMLRCGQMVIAEALVRRHLGKGWQWAPGIRDENYLRVLRMFQDKKNCTYSIHQIAQMGVSEGKTVGQWFGPNTVAHVLRQLSAFDKWSSLAVHVSMDSVVVMDDIRKICRVEVPAVDDGVRHRTQSHGLAAAEAVCWKPLLLFIPLRLGLSEINPVYYCGLKRTFALKQSVGIIGGKPNHALYIIGVVGDDLVFLDPHTTQLAVDLDVEFPEDESYHCAHASRMDIGQLDPSIALCFYLPTESEFDSWCHLAHKHLITQMKQPLFEITEHRPLGWPDFAEEQHRLDHEPQTSEFTVVEQERKYDTSDDEFEIL